MDVRMLRADGDGAAIVIDELPDGFADRSERAGRRGWVWVDVEAGPEDADIVVEFAAQFDLDRLAARDAVADIDLPKVDDFGHHLIAVLHGLRDDRFATYEVTCFLTDRVLLTVHADPSPSIVALWTHVQERPELASGGVDELAARLADVLTRRLQSVLDVFDDQVEDLTELALTADAHLLEHLTAVRTDLAKVRRVVHPQREALDLLRSSASTLISDSGRRRFSDVFDVAARASAGLDAARAALAETLDAYRGAEAREATEVSKVLTVYAAIMLPLSLVAGFFGMNFDNLPWIRSDYGWIIVTAVMAIIAFVSLGVFISLDWIRRPSGRTTGRTLGRGLLEATRAPAQIVGAVFEISTMPLKATGSLLARKDAEGSGESAGR